MTTSSANDLDWLLDDLVVRVPDVDKAVILSRDGLAIAASSALTREDSEHLAAVASGFQSLARGAGRHFGGGHVRQTIVEMDTAFLFVTSAGEGSCLAVLSPASANARPGRVRNGCPGQAGRPAPVGESPADAGRGGRGLIGTTVA